MQKLYITTNPCSSTIVVTRDGAIIAVTPLDAENYKQVEAAFHNQKTVNDWEPNWDNDGRSIEEHGEIVLKIPAEGKIEGDLEKVKALSQLG